MKLFCITYEVSFPVDENDEYLTGTELRYRYVIGNYRLGKVCYELFNEHCNIVTIDRLYFSLQRLKICLQGLDSDSDEF